MAEVLSTRELTKRYRGKTALEGLTISLEEGHIYGLVGNNGAGKTTLMRLLAHFPQKRASLVKQTEKTVPGKQVVCRGPGHSAGAYPLVMTRISPSMSKVMTPSL